MLDIAAKVNRESARLWQLGEKQPFEVVDDLVLIWAITWFAQYYRWCLVIGGG